MYDEQNEIATNSENNNVQNAEKDDDLVNVLDEFLSSFSDHDYNFDPYNVLFYDTNNDHAYEKTFDHEEVLIDPINQNCDINENTNEQSLLDPSVDHSYKTKNNEIFLCTLCLKNTVGKRHYDYDEIMNKINVVIPKKIQCRTVNKFCPKCVDNINKLYYFVQKIIESNQFFKNEKFCQICSQEVPKNYDYAMDHILKFHDNHFLSLILCMFCSTYYDSMDKLILHLYTKHGISPKSNIITSDITNLQSLKKGNVHNLKIYQELQKSYRCPECSEISFSDEQFRTHMLHVHDIALPKLNCQFCNKRFQLPSQLARHFEFHEKQYRIMNRIQLYTCSHCFETNPTENDFKLHLKLYHSKEKGTFLNILTTSDIIFRCEFCDYCCGEIDYLMMHKTNHYSNCFDMKVFYCRNCNIKFDSYLTFLNHKQSLHNKPLSEPQLQFEQRKFYVCDVCNNKYFDLYYLGVHCRLKHSLKKKEENVDIFCDHCGDFFNRIRDYEIHRINIGLENSQKCTKCLRIYDLTVFFDHQKYRGPEKEFYCKFCKEQFYFKCDFDAHWTNHENDILTNFNNFHAKKLKSIV